MTLPCSVSSRLIAALQSLCAVSTCRGQEAGSLCHEGLIGATKEQGHVPFDHLLAHLPARSDEVLVLLDEHRPDHLARVRPLVQELVRVRARVRVRVRGRVRLRVRVRLRLRLRVRLRVRVRR